MRKILACGAVLAAMTAGAYAQTTNMAISNADGTGRAEAFTITELDGATEATFQMWLKPTAWTAATLIGQDNFSVETTAEGTVMVSVGDKAVTITSDALALNTWAQLTITVDQGTVSAYVNNVAATVAGDLPTTFAATASSFDAAGCIIAEGFRGEMDEIRVWSRALAQEDFFWQNTVNKWNENYDALAAYWKCDQKGLDANLYDYRHGNTGLHHNAALTGITKVAVDDNAAFKYRVVTGYVPSLMRFTDRININRDMFLLTNDVITLSAKVQADGTLLAEYPDNSATPTNVEQLAEWEGRNGVMSFKGAGSKMVAGQSCIPYDPTAGSGLEGSPYASIMSWVYIDQWNEGAELLSDYVDADNYIIIKFGSESDKEIVVDVCGTVATLKNQIEVGKWQYVGVYISPMRGELTGRYFNPIKIGIGEYDENGEFQSTIHDKIGSRTVELSGNGMDITSLPNFRNATLTIGKDFAGKLDEFMVWGAGGGAGERSGSIANDATTEYQWNVGNWNNIFLCAYYKGDDPENVGRDWQSLKEMANIMRSYYDGYEGAKIRLGIISSLPSSGWKQVLNDDANLDRFIASAKELVKDFDGLDVDLEWAVEGNYWARYNHIVGRLADEVMFEYPDKLFTVSLHAYSYAGFDMSLLDKVDYFTMQIYDWDLSMGTYESVYEQFKGVGFTDDKLLLSYPVLVYGNSNYKGLIGGYKDLFEKWGMTDETWDPSQNSWTYGGTTYYYDGMDRMREKQQFIIDNDLRGTMYFDMGNDLRVDDHKSMIRQQNEVISANVDTVITNIDMKPSGVRNIAATKRAELFTTVQDGGNITVTLADAAEPATLAVYAVDGRTVLSQPLAAKRTTVEADGLTRGVYLLRVVQGGEEHTVKIVMR